VTGLLDGLKAGDDEAVRLLWERYFERLVRLAGARLPRHSRRSVDEEDVALSAFHSFCRRAGEGQFPRMAGRDDLWRVLATITTRKIASSIRHQTRLKRGGGNVLGESALFGETMDDGMAAILSREPTSDQAGLLVDEYDRLFGLLDDPSLKTVALRKLEGYSNGEIANEMGLSSRTVDRKLRLIRAFWEEDAAG
jgi:DNA-directed RNA polymerase specialized sigma24 family protein